MTNGVAIGGCAPCSFGSTCTVMFGSWAIVARRSLAILARTRSSTTSLPMPVLAIGARGSLAEFAPNQVARYATDVTGEVIENSGHWIFEEQPEQLADRLLRFFQ
jgi:hypothetical protein